jgi:hypothetical protein
MNITLLIFNDGSSGLLDSTLGMSVFVTRETERPEGGTYIGMECRGLDEVADTITVAIP